MTNHEYTSDDYYTPKSLFDLLNVEFDLDPAHPPFPTHVPCKKYFTIHDNGLIQPWFGSVWMNPPFSKPQPWVEKFIQHGHGIALLPQSKSNWFYNMWQTNIAITTFGSRLRFDNPRGGTGSIMMPTCLIAIGEQNIKAISNVGKVR